ncbi:uncharacterized protein LOC108488279 [Gossypium arboreum]|uniref:uncharacterized protein LOC108488279 n=1 Tax=Gossypium arboreum TaxID=29729 RepID=UPI0022F1DB72|nr:uncharacterized protein LOC108488279 [Gossypium arboreum]
MAVQRQNRGRINELEGMNGTRTHTIEEMLKLAFDFFEDLFSASKMGSDERVFGLVEKRITDDMNDSLLQQFMEEEITCAFKMMEPLKAPAVMDFQQFSFKAQGAFFPGRHISDNVLIAYEVFHSLKTKKKGFHADWIVLVMRCVCSVSYSVNLNGLSSEWDTFVEGAKVVSDVIKEYETISGQMVNFEKSLIYFGANVNVNIKDTITTTLGVRVALNPEKYLGLPMMVGCKKSWTFANFIDRFRRRIDGWSLRYLSIGGKEVFVKSILQSIPVYAMQYFELPKLLCRKLEDILLAKIGFYPSFTWRSICNARDFIADGVLWKIGNGIKVNIWNDPWLPGVENNRISGQHQVQRIISIPIFETSTEDLLVWKYEGSGEYSVKSGYRILTTDYLQNINYINSTADIYKIFYKSLRSINTPEKIKIHIWRLLNNYFPHYSNLLLRKLRNDYVCPLCKEASKDTDHLLWSCSLLHGEVLRFIHGYVQEVNLCKEKLGGSDGFLRKGYWRPPVLGFIKIKF